MSKVERPWSAAEIVVFTEALANGLTLAKAAQRALRTAAEGEAQFRRICERLGWQAQ